MKHSKQNIGDIKMIDLEQMLKRLAELQSETAYVSFQLSFREDLWTLRLTDKKVFAAKILGQLIESVIEYIVKERKPSNARGKNKKKYTLLSI